MNDTVNYKYHPGIHPLFDSENHEPFFVEAYYSINVDENRIICENGHDYSNILINPEIFLILGIERKDVVYFDCCGRWIKRRFDYSVILNHENLIFKEVY